MKKVILLFLFTLPLLGQAQESYGNTANLALGLGYRDGYRASYPIFHFNYEFDVAKNFTLAPFVTLIHYRYSEKWNNQKYYYRGTTIPVGVKGSYYFDQLFNLDSKFDIYAGGMIGFNIYSGRWNDDNYGGPGYGGVSYLYLDFNIGAEYHINEKIGLILDLSTGISTFGIAIHK